MEPPAPKDPVEAIASIETERWRARRRGSAQPWTNRKPNSSRHFSRDATKFAVPVAPEETFSPAVANALGDLILAESPRRIEPRGARSGRGGTAGLDLSGLDLSGAMMSRRGSMGRV